MLALVLVGAWLLVRERRGRLAQVIPALRREERAATLCVLAVGAQLLVAAFLAPTMFGFWFPGRHLVATLPLCVPLVALASRWVPRVGAALALLTFAASAWLYVDLRWGGGSWIDERPDAPWGPLEKAWPLFEDGSTWPFVLAAALGAACLATLIAAVLRSRWGQVQGALWER